MGVFGLVAVDRPRPAVRGLVRAVAGCAFGVRLGLVVLAVLAVSLAVVVAVMMQTSEVLATVSTVFLPINTALLVGAIFASGRLFQKVDDLEKRQNEEAEERRRLDGRVAQLEQRPARGYFQAGAGGTV